MNQEPQDPQGPLEWRRLPGADEADEPPRENEPFVVPGAVWSPPGRRDGLRRVRHVSNWTAAALIAATAVTPGYLARGSLATSTASTAGPASPAGTAGTAASGTHKSCITVPVATSGGSGVTRQAPVTTCRSGAAGSGPAVVYVTQPVSSGDN